MRRSRLYSGSIGLVLVCLFLLFVPSGVNAGPQDQYDKLIADCTRAISENPRDENAYYSRGFVYARKEQYDLAIIDFNKAITINPNFNEAYINRGRVYLQKGLYDQAIADLNKAIAITQHAVVYNTRGLASVKFNEVKN